MHATNPAGCPVFSSADRASAGLSRATRFGAAPRGAALLGALGVVLGGSTAAARPLTGRPRSTMIWESVDPGAASSGVNSHIIYLHRCTGSDCTVIQGTTNATTQPVHSSLGHGVLSAFTQGDEVWRAVSDCMRDVYSSFNVQITETSPGTAPHFEIMIGGRPEEIGLSAGIGGVSPFSCQPYIPNSVVFVFDVWGDNADEICATAAQELAHSFALDHSTEPSDPMTYFAYNGRRHYMDAQVQCGSDCDKNHRSPLGATCSGDDHQDHVCACGNGAQTQNDVEVIKSLFGDVGASPPTVKIVEPRIGDTVASSFPVSAEITDDIAVASAELRVDGALVQKLTAAPFAFTGPPTMADGTHTVEVTGYDNFGAPARARVQVIVGAGCKSAADCPDATDACIAGRCVVGPGVTGGLGQACTAQTDCASWQCANDNGAQYCVESCEVGQCPSGFGCRDDGQGGGVCWPGYNETRFAGCSAGGGSPIQGSALGLLAALVLRRRRRMADRSV
jgi:uncharacterized protein (TIGR03382 family)